MATGTKIGDAFIEVAADTSQYEKDLKGIEKTTDKTVGNVNQGLGSVGVAGSKAGLAVKAGIIGGIAVAGSAIVDFAADSLQSFSNLNESINAVNVSYGENAEAVLAIGESSAKSLGLATADFNSLSVAAAAFTEAIAAGTGKEVPEILDDLTTRVADFASVMNLDVADAFTKFRSGLAGESEPLRQFGIDVSAAAVEQEALASGLIVAGEEMTESQKVTARYLAIMRQTEKVSGDFANTADDAANKQRILNAELENSRAELGESLLPLQETWLGIQEAAIPIVAGLATELGKVTGALSAADIAIAAFGAETASTGDVIASLGQDPFNALSLVFGILGPMAEGIDALTGQSLEELVTGFEEFVDTSEFTVEQLQDVGTELDILVGKGEITREEYEALTGVVDDQITELENHAIAASDDARMIDNVERAMGPAADAVSTGSDAWNAATEAVEAHVAALQAEQDFLRAQIDPLFALRQAELDLAEATLAADEAADEYGEGSREHVDALIAQTEAGLDLDQAMIDLTGSTRISEDAFRDQLREIGLTDAEIDILIANMKELDALVFKPKSIEITVHGNNLLDAILNSDKGAGIIFSAAGGPANVGETHIVGEDGPELFIPKVNGTIIPNDQLTSLGGPQVAGAQTTVHVTIPGTGTSTGDAARVAQILNTLVRA